MLAQHRVSRGSVPRTLENSVAARTCSPYAPRQLGPEELRVVRSVACLVGRRAGACMRSKFAIWSDEGILSKPKATGFARVRGIIVVCSVCGIAAASVYSQIGADRGAPATDRATGYGAEGRPAQAQRAQSPAPLSMIDAYAHSGTTTGVASVAGAA